MSTRTPKAWETTWAQEAIRAELDRPADRFRYDADERARIEEVKASGARPEGCSDAIPDAPARGPVAEFRDVSMVPVGSDDFEAVEERYKAGCAGRVRDVFDQMSEQSARRGGKAPFTIGQVVAARAYRALNERVASSGVKLSGAFDVSTGGGGKVDFMDAYLADTERLGWFHDAIGDGIAKDTRRKVAATQGKVKIGDVELRRIGRKLITVRRLVDDVCIRERALSAVLQAHGWRATGKNRMTLRAALCAALGRMQGI